MPKVTSAPFRVLFTDLLSDQPRDVLPVSGLRFDDYIGRSGALSGTLPVPDRATAQRVQRAVIPGRTAVWVVQGSAVWWGGIAWTLTPSTDERGFVSADLQAATFDSYLDHRIVFDTLTSGHVDQFTAVRQLVDYAQSLPGGDIGITMDDAQMSSVVRNHTVTGTDMTRVREALDQLAGLEGGFEWRIRATGTPDGARRKALQLGYPVIRTGDRPVMLTHPGNVLSYSWPEDATNTANVWQSRGATQNSNQAADSAPMLSELLTRAEDLTAGWPRLDGSSDYNTVRDRQALNAHASADLAAARPVTIPTLRVRLDELTPDLIGRTVRLRVNDVWHGAGLDASYRVVGWQATPEERGSGGSAEIYLEG
ncbi:hypothetical protein RM844_16965 [Streptomyces sp. DSM 44915]|uniref:Minor tail protein n=1 Tax=Streptomyces chisholmiae TaxID=3075540 RepID=A0ABU2JTB4_9ACTN|nr:hypothetical protein [Streptomyces sp. DSM 44915]MDT0267973.1 hypothetical protein [Streptomyces sp. DSM 44915]